MSRAICPGLEKSQSGYLCAFSQRPVNPFQWYCLTDYVECPIYVQYIRSRAATVKPEAKVTQTVQPLQPQQAPVKQGEAGAKVVEEDPEEGLLSTVESLVAKFEERVKALVDKWRDYESSVVGAKQAWDREKVRLRQYLSVLSNAHSKYSEELREVELRRNLGLIDQETYSRLKGDLERRIGKIGDRLRELQVRFAGLDTEIGQHFKRVITASASPEINRLKLSLAKLEEMYRSGKVSKEIYEKLKAELEGVIT